jgi:ComEC/Rec2-related protein
LLTFSLCTGLRASAIRALTMIAVMLGARWVYRRPQALNALCLSAILILGIAPGQVADIGFQFSFLMVGGLLTLGPLLDTRLRAWTARDPWAVVSPRQFWVDRKIKEPVVRSVGVSLLCTLLAAPLTAFSFSLFSPVGIVGNLLAVPLVFLVLVFGFAALPFLVWPGPWSAVAFRPALQAAEALMAWVEMLNRLPGAVHWVRSPPLWMVLLSYALLAAWVAWPRRRSWALAAGLVLAGYAGTEAWLHARRTELVVLEADRGQAAWLRHPNGKVVLVDCGSDWSGWDVQRALQRHGIDRLHAVVFTHPDPRHVEGWREVFSHTRPEEIWVSTMDRDHPLFTAEEWETIGLEAGDLFTRFGWEVDVLWPPADLVERSSDDCSLVLRFSDGFASVLFMGGATERVEQQLVASQTALPTRILLAGHHRSRPGASSAFLASVRPDVVVVSGQGFDGISPAREETEARVLEAGIPLLQLPPAREVRLNPRRATLRR